MLRITVAILPEQPRTPPQQCCGTAGSTQDEMLPAALPSPGSGSGSFQPTVFMPRWALTPRGAVQCFAIVAEALGRFLEHDRAPWPQLSSSQAAGWGKLHRAQIQLRYQQLL